MVADIVMCENLQRTLARADIALLFRSEAERNELLDSVNKVKGALLALEAGQRMEDPEGAQRLANLVALLYQADDLFDVYLASADHIRVVRDMENRNSWAASLKRTVNAFTQEVSQFFSPSNQPLSPLVMASHVTKIRQEVKQVMEMLRRRLPDNDLPDRQFEPPELRLAENTVLGRDEDKKKIIEMLLQPKTESECNVSVIPIVGLPGLGKSTLAQIVYDDEKVKNHFDLRMWVRVSHIYDEKEIIREIVESCTSRTSCYRENSRPANLLYSTTQRNERAFPDLLGCRNFAGSTIISSSYTSSQSDVNIFERRLRKEIDGKLFLLILDDACIKHWLPLKDLLARGATGSHILVTTSSVEVADLAKTETVEVYHLKGLRSRASWSLFKQLAFRREDHWDRELKRIGKSIIGRCQGVPLTIKVAGSFLYGKSKEKWQSFETDLMLSSETYMMDLILQLSYTDLPIHLKACFSYCSLFPEDFDFNKHDLHSFWIAQGFVNPQQDQSLEGAAEMYFLELSRRCFFQDVRTDDLGDVVICKMHPIIRNLACQNAPGVVSMYMEDSSASNVLDSSCKHVSFNCDIDSSIIIQPPLLQAQSLRTLVSVKESDHGAKVCSLPYNLLISHYKCLRVLDLHNHGIEELPDSIGKLIHLRYLDLSKNDPLVNLPKSITKLYNLQTLKLNSCPKLRRLPGNFSELVNLKHIEVDECDSLICMPPGLEELTQLQTLNRFVVGRDGSRDMPNTGLKALKKLNNLRGRLAIELTGDWMTNLHEASEAELMNKTHLSELQIIWTQLISDVEKSTHLLSQEERESYQDLLEQLQPSSNLKSLCIEGYKGEDFPNWARVDLLASLPNLVIVSIEGCKKCQHLPPFGELPSLKQLTLRHMANVEYVEMETSVEPFFQSLEELTLHNFYKLEGWRKDMMMASRHQAAIRYFPRLSKLRIWNCPKLTSMPLFSGAVDLDLRNVNQKLLEDCEKKASTDIWSQTVNVSCTKRLQIRRCPNLESFTAVRKGLGGLPCLQQLVVERCDALTSLASELWYLTSLERLEISSCKELDLSKNTSKNSGNNSTTSWISRSTFRNSILGGIPNNPWFSLKGLRHLTLREIPKMKTLPEGLKHVQTLRVLWISACNALTSLPEWMGSLMVLQHLRIESCPALTRLPDGIKEVRSLMKVEITECPELMERCREHTGEDWHKIKHARILLHKSWRYGLVSEPGPSQRRSNVRTLADVKYVIIPVVTAGIE